MSKKQAVNSVIDEHKTNTMQELLLTQNCHNKIVVIYTKRHYVHNETIASLAYHITSSERNSSGGLIPVQTSVRYYRSGE